MKNSVNKSTFRLAFCSVIAALGVVLMMLTTLIPVGTYAFPCFAGILTIAIVVEYDCKWAFGVYAVICVLSFFLSGDKEAVMYLIVFFGYYPIIKNVFERYIKKKIVLYILKLVLFNAAAIASFYAGMYILSIPDEEYTIFGVYLPIVFLLLGNVFFIVYDIAVSVYVRFYVQRVRNIIFK